MHSVDVTECTNRTATLNDGPSRPLLRENFCSRERIALSVRIPEEVHSNTGRSDIGKASAVLYDDTGDVRKARHVRDEPHYRVKVISVHRQAPWSWKELMTAVDQIGAIGMSQASCESVLVSNHTVEQ